MLSPHHLTSTIVLALALALCAQGMVVRQDIMHITLPLARRLNTTGTAKLLEQDQARAKALVERTLADPAKFQNAPTNVPATNVAVGYITSVNVGSGDPPQQFDLLIDTGSSNTWVGADLANKLRPTQSTRLTLDLVAVVYGSGAFVGNEVLDTVDLGHGLSIKNQSFGSALVAEGFDGFDGILGIGPTDLTCGTLLGPDITSCVPTITDNAVAQGLISESVVGISFRPTTSESNTNGELTFGGVNPSRFTPGELRFVPITSNAPASSYVGIDQSITYGRGGTTILSQTSGIVDTGTTLILLATDAFNAYRSATGGVPDATTGLLRITPDQFANLQSLFFHIGDTQYEFTPNAQIWPRTLNSAIGGTPDSIYLVVNDIGAIGSGGIDFINGMTFLERFYHVFDSGRGRVGFATTQFTHADTN
ncbi:acid protease [Earliella scabrosa]|nr:acid protease [Earliella scabrosa]